MCIFADIHASKINYNQNNKIMEELKTLILKTLILNSTTKVEINKEEYMKVLKVDIANTITSGLTSASRHYK